MKKCMFCKHWKKIIYDPNYSISGRCHYIEETFDATFEVITRQDDSCCEWEEIS